MWVENRREKQNKGTDAQSKPQTSWAEMALTWVCWLSTGPLKTPPAGNNKPSSLSLKPRKSHLCILLTDRLQSAATGWLKQTQLEMTVDKLRPEKFWIFSKPNDRLGNADYWAHFTLAEIRNSTYKASLMWKTEFEFWNEVKNGICFMFEILLIWLFWLRQLSTGTSQLLNSIFPTVKQKC